MLGNDLKAVDGPEAGSWIEPALEGEVGAVTNQVPNLFEAYARVFHPVADEEGNHLTWAEVARQLGRIAHPEMQWHQIVGISDTFGIEGSRWSGSIPNLGEMEIEDLDRLCGVLGEHTADPAHCYFGLCTINLHPLVNAIEDEQGKRPQLELPLGRDHLVLAGPLAAVSQIGYREPSTMSWSASSSPAGEAAEPEEFDFPDSFWREAPNLIWPDDRSWFVVSEVDFDSTLVGGSRDVVAALTACPGLEVHEVTPGTKMTAFSDQLNPVPKPEGW